MMPLRDARKALARFVGESGMCEDDARVVEAINDARRILYPMGDWEGITDPLCVKPYACNFTLPADYDYAKKGYACRGRIHIQNDWFTPITGAVDDYCGSAFALRRIPGQHATFRDWPCVKQERSCCPPEGFYIQIEFEAEEDCGVELTFNCIGAMTRRFSLTRTLQGLPFKRVLPMASDRRILKIETVIKPKTVGRIRVYGNDAANDLLMAIYEPDDINPSYSRYGVGGYCGPVIVKAKKRFREVVEDHEFVDLNVEALIHALQAITERQNRNVPGFNANLSLARDFLNRELAGPESTATSPMRMSDAYRVTGLIE